MATACVLVRFLPLLEMRTWTAWSKSMRRILGFRPNSRRGGDVLFMGTVLRPRIEVNLLSRLRAVGSWLYDVSGWIRWIIRSCGQSAVGTFFER